MKIIITLATVLLSMPGARADVADDLKKAVLTLPPRYLADVPLEGRKALLDKISADPKDPRLDNGHGWIHYSSDGGDHEDPKERVTSMFWVKLLPRDDQSPLVFVHMSKPFADASAPSDKQTFVLEKDGGEWKDVTMKVIPKNVDITAHFRPRRKINEIEVAPFKQFPRQDNGRAAYEFGDHTIDLVWNGSTFTIRKARTTKLSGDND